MNPDFDEIVGTEVTSDAERDRLRQVHELLVSAGPPPELTPRLERAPAASSNVISLPQFPVKRRVTLLFAAAVLALGVFIGGYAIGFHRSATGQAVERIGLRGTAKAPHAIASLALLPATQGNWPMTLNVSGLPASSHGAYYEVYLVRNGKPWGSCGTFVISNSAQPVSVPLNAPYRLRNTDTWIVTLEKPGKSSPVATVLKPV